MFTGRPASGAAVKPGPPIRSLRINNDKNFCFVDLRSAEEATNALALDGLVGDGVFLGEGARLAVAEVAEDFGEFADVVRVFLLVGGVADAAAFVGLLARSASP